MYSIQMIQIPSCNLRKGLHMSERLCLRVSSSVSPAEAHMCTHVHVWLRVDSGGTRNHSRVRGVRADWSIIAGI